MPRLFVALEVPRNAAMSLSLLRGGLPGARWIDVENFHITLRFIGDIDGRTADEVVDKLDRIERPEFQLALSGMGCDLGQGFLFAQPMAEDRFLTMLRQRSERKSA